MRFPEYSHGDARNRAVAVLLRRQFKHDSRVREVKVEPNTVPGTSADVMYIVRVDPGALSGFSDQEGIAPDGLPIVYHE